CKWRGVVISAWFTNGKYIHNHRGHRQSGSHIKQNIYRDIQLQIILRKWRKYTDNKWQNSWESIATLTSKSTVLTGDRQFINYLKAQQVLSEYHHYSHLFSSIHFR